MALRQPQVDAVILDLGNVLVFHDNEKLFNQLEQRAGLPKETIARLITPELWNTVHGGLDEDGLRRLVCDALGIRVPAEEFDALWNSHFSINQPVLPIVESLVGRVKLVLLSNTNPIHARHLVQLVPLLRKFDQLVFSHEVCAIKPERRIYEEALRRAEAVPDRTAFFDDLPEYVEAAKELGIRSYVFRSPAEFASQLAELGL
jgi:putative hydrolase of the HAD superfamily